MVRNNLVNTSIVIIVVKNWMENLMGSPHFDSMMNLTNALAILMFASLSVVSIDSRVVPSTGHATNSARIQSTSNDKYQGSIMVGNHIIIDAFESVQEMEEFFQKLQNYVALSSRPRFG